eukprot:COSAG05_NODE_1964_length_3773_cov_3.834241_3_plen_84_part_00
MVGTNRRAPCSIERRDEISIDCEIYYVKYTNVNRSTWNEYRTTESLEKLDSVDRIQSCRPSPSFRLALPHCRRVIGVVFPTGL